MNEFVLLFASLVFGALVLATLGFLLLYRLGLLEIYGLSPRAGQIPAWHYSIVRTPVAVVQAAVAAFAIPQVASANPTQIITANRTSSSERPHLFCATLNNVVFVHDKDEYQYAMPDGRILHLNTVKGFSDHPFSAS